MKLAPLRDRCLYLLRIDRWILESLKLQEEGTSFSQLQVRSADGEVASEVLQLALLERARGHESSGDRVNESGGDPNAEIGAPGECSPVQLRGWRLWLFAAGMFCLPLAVFSGFVWNSISIGVFLLLFGVVVLTLCIAGQVRSVRRYGGWLSLHKQHPKTYVNLSMAVQAFIFLPILVMFWLLIGVVLYLLSAAQSLLITENGTLYSGFVRVILVAPVVSLILVTSSFWRIVWQVLRGWSVLNLPPPFAQSLYSSHGPTKQQSKELVTEEEVRNPLFTHGRLLVAAALFGLLALNCSFIDQIVKVTELGDDMPKRIGRIFAILLVISESKYFLMILGNILCPYFVYLYAYRVSDSWHLPKKEIRAMISAVITACVLVGLSSVIVYRSTAPNSLRLESKSR